MSQSVPYCYEFGPFRLNPLEHLLLRDGAEVPLPPKAFSLLLLLVRNPGHLLEKEVMLRAIWPDAVVEEGSLTRNVSTLRQVLGESRNGPQYILTVPKCGYRFVAAVREVWDKRAGEVEPAPASLARRSIAVLPFQPLVAEDGDESLGLGIADTLITKLGGARRMLVQPTSAVRKYVRLNQDARAAGRELMVEAVLDGSIQRSGERIRVTVRLVTVNEGVTIWAGLFDEKFTNVFALQDAISERIAEVLGKFYFLPAQI
jgi:DNA-binding winged helix-turn-helix (wHTH) protein